MRTKIKVFIMLLLFFSFGMFTSNIIYAEASYPEDVSLKAEIVDGTNALVTIDYNFQLDGETDQIPFKAVLFFDTTIEDVALSIDGEPQEINLTAQDDNVVTGEVLLGEEISKNSNVSVNIEYLVRDAVLNDDKDFKVNIPVIANTWAPLEAAPGFFTGDVSLPENASITEGFPTKIATGDMNEAKVDLQVIPAMVALKGTTDSPPMFTYFAMMNILVLSIIVVSGAALWWFWSRSNKKDGS